MRQTSLLAAILCVFLSLLALAPVGHSGSSASGSLVVVGHVSGVISGATYDYFVALRDYAVEAGASLVVVELNTPGGSLESALSIADLLRSSPVPFAVLVVDRWAMSAGTIITVCSDIAAMQPGTLIGAVQPVVMTGSGEFVPVNESKTLNPVYKSIEVCLELHRRNTSVARRFVYENLVLTADEAARMHVIDFTAYSPGELVEKANGTLLPRLGTRLVLREPVRFVEYSMPIGLRLAQVLGDPLVSSILSSIAMLVILVGLASGHPLVAALGIGLLLLGLFGLGLSASLVAVALIVVGLVMLVVELVAIPGFGVVGFTGVLLTIIGVLVLFSWHPVYMSPAAMAAALKVMLAVVIPLAGFVGVAVYKVLGVWKRRPLYSPSVVGKRGRALDDIPPGREGFVMVEGEYWMARNTGGEPVRRGDVVVVVGKEGAVLLVRKASGEG